MCIRDSHKIKYETIPAGFVRIGKWVYYYEDGRRDLPYRVAIDTPDKVKAVPNYRVLEDAAQIWAFGLRQKFSLTFSLEALICTHMSYHETSRKSFIIRTNQHKKIRGNSPWIPIGEFESRHSDCMNEARFSNIFIEKRASSCPQSLEKSRLFSYPLLMSEGENSQNVKRIFLRKVVIWTQFYDKLAQYASSNACGVLYFKVRWGRSSL